MLSMFLPYHFEPDMIKTINRISTEPTGGILVSKRFAQNVVRDHSAKLPPMDAFGEKTRSNGYECFSD